MKKTFLSLILFVILAGPAFSQLKGGLKAGLNLTDLIVTNGAGYFDNSAFNTRASYHFGSYVQKGFSKHFGFQVEMLFSNKGCTIESDSISTAVSLNYLNWPILLEYQLGSRLDFSAGIELGLLVAGEDIYRDFDLGIDVGLEFDISKKLLVGLRYNHGLPVRMKINSYENSGTDPSYQHSVLQFYVGFNLVNEPAENQ